MASNVAHVRVHTGCTPAVGGDCTMLRMDSVVRAMYRHAAPALQPRQRDQVYRLTMPLGHRHRTCSMLPTPCCTPQDLIVRPQCSTSTSQKR